MANEVEKELKLVNHKLDHQHEMLHAVGETLALIVKALPPSADMTPADVQKVVGRLEALDAKLKGIAADPAKP